MRWLPKCDACSCWHPALQVRPGPIKSPLLVSKFTNKEDLIGAIVSSCYIPFYLAK
jgi:hypothetical protein